MAGNIPIIALQVSTLQVEDKLILHFTKVLDQRSLREDDDTASKNSQPTPLYQ